MKDVLFFTTNRGAKSAAEFILVALNTGGPQRFGKIDFKLIDKDDATCSSLYDTTYKSGHESLLSVETVRVNVEEERPQFFFMVVLRLQSFQGSVKSRTMIPIPEEYPRFPNLDTAWHEKVRSQLGHMTNQDLWNHLLNIEKIRRMPL